MDGIQLIEGEVRELIRRQRLDPDVDQGALQTLVRDVVDDYEERSLTGGLAPLVDTEAATRSVLDSVMGYGPLQQYFDDPQIEEIWIYDSPKNDHSSLRSL